jgi:hypothetical protein
MSLRVVDPGYSQNFQVDAQPRRGSAGSLKDRRNPAHATETKIIVKRASDPLTRLASPADAPGDIRRPRSPAP